MFVCFFIKKKIVLLPICQVPIYNFFVKYRFASIIGTSENSWAKYYLLYYISIDILHIVVHLGT